MTKIFEFSIILNKSHKILEAESNPGYFTRRNKKANFTLERAMKAQSEIWYIALLFL